MRENILLIYPPVDEDYFTEGMNDSPPLGLVVLQNYLTLELGLSVNIDIIDGEYNSLQEILDLVASRNYDIVGLQPMMASYKNTLKLLQAAKEQGAITVLGGHHSTQLAPQIIGNRSSIVDFVIAGDGEEAFAGLVTEEKLESVPNLVYEEPKTKQIIHTPQRNVPLKKGKIICFDNHMLAQYQNSTQLKLERGEPLVSFRSYSHKGCGNRANSQYCYFCGRADKGVRFKAPEDYVDELSYLSNLPSTKYIFEIGDDFLQDTEWISRVCELKENRIPNRDVHLKIFARANRITPEIIELLKRLNVDEVAIGFESGSEKILRRINKNASPQDNLRAAELLFSNGIDTIASFVLGLPGEDEVSLKETYEQAEYVRDLSFKYLGKPPQEIIANLIEINPGSPAYKKLQKNFGGKFLTCDNIGVAEAQDDYFKMEFGLQSDGEILAFRNHIAAWGKKINGLGQYTYPAGWRKGDME